MELLILGGLAAIGYTLNQKGKQSRYEHKEIKRDPGQRYPYPPEDVKVQTEDKAIYEKRFAASMNPAETGIIPPGMGASELVRPNDLKDHTGKPVMPFFSSERKQHTSTQLKQSRLELFTGQIYEDQSQTGFYKNKEERAPFFKPSESAVQVSFSGSGGNPTYQVESDRFQVMNKKHHMTPTPQVRVGPGIGVAPDVPSAGGFHEQFRILPPNVGGYKKNNLPGRIVPGGAGVAQRGSVGPVNKNQPEREAAMPDPMQGRSVLTGPTGRAAVQFHNTNLVGGEYFGGAGAGVVSKPTAGQAPLTNVKDDNTARGALGLSNITGARLGVGAYTYTTPDAKETMRASEATGGLTGVRGGAAMYTTPDPLLGQTNRTIDQNTPQLAPPGTRVSATQARVAAPSTTHRQQTGYTAYVGGASAAATGASHADRTYVTKNVDQARARRDITNHSFTPGPQRVNNWTGQTGVVTSSTQLYDTPARPPVPKNMDVGGRVVQVHEKRNALPADNPRMWAP